MVVSGGLDERIQGGRYGGSAWASPLEYSALGGI